VLDRSSGQPHKLTGVTMRTVRMIAVISALTTAHAAPASSSPTMAVLPSSYRATRPCPAVPAAPVPTSFGPWCVNCANPTFSTGVPAWRFLGCEA
jgi:invasion protein IalB